MAEASEAEDDLRGMVAARGPEWSIDIDEDDLVTVVTIAALTTA